MPKQKRYSSTTKEAAARIGKNEFNEQLCEAWLMRGRVADFRGVEKLMEVAGFFAMLAGEMVPSSCKVLVAGQVYDSLEEAVAAFGGNIPNHVEFYRLAPVSKKELRSLKKKDVAFGFDED